MSICGICGESGAIRAHKWGEENRKLRCSRRCRVNTYAMNVQHSSAQRACAYLECKRTPSAREAALTSTYGLHPAKVQSQQTAHRAEPYRDNLCG